MGKSFAKELDAIPSTFDWAIKADVAKLHAFASEASRGPLIAIGAGGSYTVAALTCLLHETTGGLGQAHTPQSFLQSKADLRDACVAIFTASGNNRDILAAYEAAATREPRSILIICGKLRSKIRNAAQTSERTVLYAEDFPAGKDGYLATNSLVAFFVLVARAFGTDAEALRRSVDGNATDHVDSIGIEKADHFLVLHGHWATPAALDLESKFSEAGLGGVMLSDYRNFAHGRHNWIDKRGGASVVVALTTPSSAKLAEKTLGLLPKSTRVVRLATASDDASGSLDLLLKVFYLTKRIGNSVGIDPGRPGVPGYGRKLYHMGPGTLEIASGNAAVARKISANKVFGAEAVERTAGSCRAYVDKLAKAKFGGLILDFDGTVAPPGQGGAFQLPEKVTVLLEELLGNGIPIYFATGRGDSIHTILLNSIAPRFHASVFISYYNGAVTSCLTEPAPAPSKGAFTAEFETIISELKTLLPILQLARVDNKDYQLTIRVTDKNAMKQIVVTVSELLRHKHPRLRLVQSSHSLDVVPDTSTKLNCVEFAKNVLPRGKELLAIGDRGSLEGNDYDLLAHAYSLSVDMVSASRESCWNLLPGGVRNVQGLIWYGGHMRIKRGHFTVKIPTQGAAKPRR